MLFRCICKDSNIYCTERDCDINDNNDDDDDDEKDMCKKCRSQPVRRVCGSNGQTYYNKCTALYCYGLSPVDIIDGPCAKHVRNEDNLLLIMELFPLHFTGKSS